MDKELIRNFSIIAHIDHGKSTLADRLIEFTCALSKDGLRAQLLDDMDLERERGITIKASSVRLTYKTKEGKEYLLNLIDTPGHVDFTYEVSKSLAACEGALLVVDAAQGIEAQTVANLFLASEHNLKIIPIINKIDLSTAEPERVKKQITDILKFKDEDIIFASAKEGIGIDGILERIVRDIPFPRGNDLGPLQALVFDSVFDVYKGVIVYVRVVNGQIKPGMEIKMMETNKTYHVLEVGVLKPSESKILRVGIEKLGCGEVGFITCNIKEAKEVIIGDTITTSLNPAKETLPGYRKFHPMVFSGIYPVNSKDFISLKAAMEKLKLSDASFIYELETSGSFGFGFRCGFLGLLHMEIVQERLEREYGLNLVLTTPNVIYKVKKKNGETFMIDNPTKFPAQGDIIQIEEPYVRSFMMIPVESIGDVIDLTESRRGKHLSTEYLSSDMVKLVYELPLSEIIVDFYDRLKSITHGYGSLDYEIKGYMPGKLVKLDVLINGKILDALSLIVHREKAPIKARALVNKLKELIPRQLFEVVIQAAIGSQIIVRETVRPLGKNVTGKCYGGDITRKRKLWEKQKAGKRRMKQFGKVEIPQEAFMAALKI